MNDFIQFIPTVCLYFILILAVLSMFFMFVCKQKEYSSKRAGNEEASDFYKLQSNFWDFSCQMSIGSAGLILFFKEDDIWCLLIGIVFYILAIRTRIELKRLLETPG